MKVIKSTPDEYVVEIGIELEPKTMDEYKEEFKDVITDLTDLMDEVYTLLPDQYKDFEKYVYEELKKWIDQ